MVGNFQTRLTGGLPSLTLTVLCLLLTLPRVTEGKAEHRLIGEPCGPELGTCSSNQALHCDLVNQVCICPEGSEWVQEHLTRPHVCRITPGQKCTYLDYTGPQCMGNYHCVPDLPVNRTLVEGEEILTICKCGLDHGCVELDSSHEDGSVHSDGPQGRDGNHGNGAILLTVKLITLIVPEMFLFMLSNTQN